MKIRLEPKYLIIPFLLTLITLVMVYGGHNELDRVEEQNVFILNQQNIEKPQIQGEVLGITLPTKGYTARPNGFDLNDDNTIGEVGVDDLICDGTTGTGPEDEDIDGDGTAEDQFYVDCGNTTGNAANNATCGGPDNPCLTLNYTVDNRVDGAGNGEDIMCFTGICNESQIDLDTAGASGTYVKTVSGSEERDWNYPSDPFTLAGWDFDNDNSYPPFDSDDIAEIDGTGTTFYGLYSRANYLEYAHFTVRDFGDPPQADSTGVFNWNNDNEDADYIHIHDIETYNINDDQAAGSSKQWLSGWSIDAKNWIAVTNVLMQDTGGWATRGNAGTGSAGPMRWQNVSYTALGANGLGTRITKSWGHLDDFEILDSVWDGNTDNWTPGAGGANSVIPLNLSACVRGWTIRNNTFLNTTGVMQTETGESCTTRTTDNIVVDKNLYINTFDYPSTSQSRSAIQIGHASVAGSEGVEDITVTNNIFIDKPPGTDDDFSRCLFWFHGNNLGGVGDLVFSNNTCIGFNEEGLNIVPGGTGLDTITLENNIILDTDEETVRVGTSNFNTFNSDYNIFNPGDTYEWHTGGGLNLSAWRSASGGDANATECNPTFVNEGGNNYHLDSGDTCAAGAGTSIAGILYDIDGDDRPLGAWDAGADEINEGGTPPPVNGQCGTAERNYTHDETSYSGSLPSAGSASPSSPPFPAQGGSESWQCLGSGGGTNDSCTATRDSAPPPDTTDPTVSMTAPGAGTTVRGTISLQATASDDTGVVGVQFTVNGVDEGAEDTTSPYSISWNSTGVSDGQHSVGARARDAAGNASTDTVTVTVDNSTPVRSNGAPSGTLPSGTTQTTISLDTNEDATCKYDTASGTAYSSMSDTFSTTGGTTHSDTVTDLADGQTYTYYVRCQDTVGNTNTTDFTISFSIDSAPPPPGDTTPPTISNVDATTETTDQVRITATWDTDEDANSQVEYGTTDSYGAFSTLYTTLTTNHSVTIEGLQRKTNYHYRVHSTDASGNSAVSSDNTIRTSGKPPKVRGLKAREGSVILEWDAITDPLVESILIFRATTGKPIDPTTETPFATLDADTTTYTDDTVDFDTTYHYSVFTKDQDGEYSDAEKVTMHTSEEESDGGTSSGGGGGGSSSSGGTSGNTIIPTEGLTDADRLALIEQIKAQLISLLTEVIFLLQQRVLLLLG